MDIKSYLKEKGSLVEEYLESYFGQSFSAPSVIGESMRYSLLAGGKRIRPVLAMASYETCGGDAEDIVDCVSALEVIHTYSLIHDDLPAMDNDDLRRGKPTNHKVFGEAIAVLAGDGLLTEAFLMMLNAKGRIKDSAVIEAAREVSIASGVRGMVGGQVQDIISEGADPDRSTLDYIHRHKTGALILASVRVGGILAEAGEMEMSGLSEYGEHVGLAFQIIDDILDVQGDTATLGKPAGSDAKNRKMTYPLLFGLEVSREKAGEHVRAAVAALKPFGEKAKAMKEIAEYMLMRTH